MPITTQNFDAGTSLPSGWLQDSANNYTFVADAAAPSQPNDAQCADSATSPGLVATLWYNTLDGNSGNVIANVSCTIGGNSTASSNIFARCTAHPEAWNLITCYVAGISTTGVELGKQIAGSFTLITSVNVTLTTNHFYRLILNCNGSTLTVSVQDLANSKWLDNTGTFQTGSQINCISTTDTSIAAQGYSGVATYTANASSSPVFKYDDFELDAATTSLVAGTVSATVASSTSIALSTTAATGGSTPYNYQFQRAPDVSGSPGTFANVGPNSSATTYTDTGLTTRTRYWYQCVVTDNASNTATSNQVKIWPGAATTYFISAAGSDSNNGTSSGTPWQTVTKVNGWAKFAGDTYQFNGGDTFAGALLDADLTSGTQSARITYQSYGTGQGTIDSSGSPNSAGVQVLNQEFITVNNLLCSGPGVNASTGVTTSTTPGIDVYSTVTSGNKWRSNYVKNCTVTGYHDGILARTPIGGANGVQIIALYATGGTFTVTFGANTTSAQNFNVSAATLQSQLQGLASIGSGNVTVTSPTTGVYVLTWAGALAGATQPLVTVNGSSLTGTGNMIKAIMKVPGGISTVVGFEDLQITNCTAHACLLSGIYTEGAATNSGSPWYFPLGHTTFQGVYVGSNTAYDIYGGPIDYPLLGSGIWFLNCSGLIAERNVIHDCGTLAALRVTTPGGIGALVFLECDKSVMQFNEAYNIFTNLPEDGCAFDLDGGVTNSILQGNYSHECDGAGIQSGTFTGSNPTSGNVFRYNISRNDMRKNNQGSLGTFGGSGTFHNNTVYLDASGASGTPSAIYIADGYNWYNNILVTVGGLALGAGTLGSGAFIGNLYWPSGGSFSMFGSGSLAAWRGTGQESDSGINYGVNADPLLSSPTSGSGTGTLPTKQVNSITYFDIASNSPAKGAGVPPGLIPLIIGTTDFHEYPSLTGAGADIGAVAQGAQSLLPATGGGTVGFAA